MLFLTRFSEEDWRLAYEFFQTFQSENGFENIYFGMEEETFLSYAVKERIDSENGVAKPGLVPDTWYFLHEDERIIGLFKLRHHLNDALIKHGGHVGYYIVKDKRHMGYGKRGLELLIDEVRHSPLFKDDELYLTILPSNIPSLRLALSCGGYIHSISSDLISVRIPLDGRGFVPPIIDHEFQSPDKITPSAPVDLPPKLVISFFEEVIISLLEEDKIELIYTFSGETKLPVYRFKSSGVLLIHGIVGEPSLANYLEDLISCGVKDVVFVGGAGALDGSDVGDVLIVRDAYRDEGFSYHYLPPSRTVSSDSRLQDLAYRFLSEEGIDCVIGDTWTTDAPYRESEKQICHYRSLGCRRVEMEQAGLISLAIARKINYIGLLYSGDDVSAERHADRDWKGCDALRLRLTLLAERLVESI